MTARCATPAGRGRGLLLAWSWCVLWGLLAGCAGRPVAPPELAAPLRLDEVPFWPQTRYQCGPAALAAVLNHSGVEVTPTQLESLIYLPQRRGSLQPELRGAPRAYGRIAWPLPPRARALRDSLAAGTPVLVLLNRGWGWFPVWHYAVVTGLSDQGVRLHSGTRRDTTLRWSRFSRQWDGSGNWAIVVLPPQRLPAALGPQALTEVLAGIEADFPELAAPAYAAALQRWPDQPALLYGHGTALYHLGRHAEAAARFRRLLARQPGSVPARNNLALALAGLGQRRQARVMLQALLDELPPDSAWRGPVSDSLASLRD